MKNSDYLKIEKWIYTFCQKGAATHARKGNWEFAILSHFPKIQIDASTKIFMAMEI